VKRVSSRVLPQVYRKLFSAFGPQHWWPGETPFEVAVGALLTQNTSWSNASAAVQELKRLKLLDPGRLEKIPQRRLAEVIHSSGYFNQKAKRLKVFVRHLNRRYGGRMDRMRAVSAGPLREELLSLWGIGPETADSILLYGLEKPVFVVDAYTKRILARHSLIPWDATYSQIQELFHSMMGQGRNRTAKYNEYHALIVETGKKLCRARPDCSSCPLQRVGNLKLEPGVSIRSKMHKK
jgi:endonuclease-3 related protein